MITLLTIGLVMFWINKEYRLILTYKRKKRLPTDIQVPLLINIQYRADSFIEVPVRNPLYSSTMYIPYKRVSSNTIIIKNPELLKLYGVWLYGYYILCFQCGLQDYVIVTDDAYESFSNEVKKFLIGHELGHVVHGHFKTPTTKDNHLEKELEATYYSFTTNGTSGFDEWFFLLLKDRRISLYDKLKVLKLFIPHYLLGWKWTLNIH